MHKPRKESGLFSSSRFRNIIVISTGALLICGATAFVWSLLPRKLHPHLQLPRLEDASSSLVEWPGPCGVTIEVDKDGGLSMHEVPFSAEALGGYLKYKYTKYGEYPVAIAADAQASLSDVYKVLELIQGTQLWSAHFVTSINEHQSRIKLLHVMLPWSWKENPEAGDILVISLERSGIMLQGKTVSREEMSRQLDRLSLMATNVLAIVRPAKGASYSDLIYTLYACDRAHFTNVCLDRLAEG